MGLDFFFFELIVWDLMIFAAGIQRRSPQPACLLAQQKNLVSLSILLLLLDESWELPPQRKQAQLQRGPQSDPMSSPAAAAAAEEEEEETADLTMEEGEEGRSEAALGGARVSAGDEDGGVEPRTTCCVCMESWTCSGAHRVW